MSEACWCSDLQNNGGNNPCQPGKCPNVPLDVQLTERTRELEAERATSHGLRLLNGTNDAVQVELIRERDEALRHKAEWEALHSESTSHLMKERDEARAESARLREALREITRSGPDDGWQAARIARQALAKETT